MSTKVLVVNDEEQYSNVLAHSLADRGFVITCAPRGEDAVAFLREHDVDVVLLDVAMLGEGALETLREIKLLNPLAQVIMLTPDNTIDVAIRGMKLGAYDYVVTPGQSEQIEEKIRNARLLKGTQEERIKRAEVDRLVMKREW